AQLAAQELAAHPSPDLGGSEASWDRSESSSAAEEEEEEEASQEAVDAHACETEDLPPSQDCQLDDSEMDSSSAEDSSGEERDCETGSDHDEPGQASLSETVQAEEDDGNGVVRNSFPDEVDRCFRRWYQDKDFPDNEDEAWYYMPQGHLLRLDNSTSEAQKLAVEQAMDEDLAKILEETGVLQAGSLPSAHAATEAGEKALMALFDNEGAVQKRTAKPKKDKEATEAEEMKPKTLQEFLAWFQSFELNLCMQYPRLRVLVLRQVAEKKPDILKDSTKARETSITLTNLNYGGDLSGQLLTFSKQMELAYKKITQLEGKSGSQKNLKKILKWVDAKKPWFRQAQAAANGLQSGLKSKKKATKKAAAKGVAGDGLSEPRHASFHRRRNYGSLPHSHAAEELLEMIGSGKMNVSHVQGLAAAMVRDGIPQESVAGFASLGSFGAHASNAERDLHTWLRGIYGMTLEPYFIAVMLQRDDIGGEEDTPLKETVSTKIPVLLPHEVFSAIHSASDYQAHELVFRRLAKRKISIDWACFYGFRGDQKARRECHFFTRHYNCTMLCDRCCAMKPAKTVVDGMNYKNFSADAPFLLTTIDHDTYVNTTPAAELSPWTAMPGWKIENTFFDWMHVVLLGVAKDVAAAAIKLMVMRGVMSGLKLREELKALTTWIKRERKRDDELVQMALTVQTLNKAQRLLDHSGLLMSAGDSTRFNAMVHLHLRTWQRLALKFEALGIPLCNIRPKHHYLQHLALYVAATRVNVRIHQNFNSESYMGKVKRIAIKCHSVSMLLRVQQRYVLYLALLWDRAKRASAMEAGALVTAGDGGETVHGILERDWQMDRERAVSSSSAYAFKRRCIMSK
ncbi:nipblb, partial [Symbiodinium microadriaticum]